MLLAFDLDKTLVTNDFQMPDDVERAVRAARDAGHLVTVLTGRPRVAAQEFLDRLSVDGHFSVNHGAQVFGAAGRELRRRRLASADVDAMLGAYLEDAALEFSCVIDDCLWVRDPDHERWNWVHTRNRRIDRFRTGLALDADKVVFYADGRSEALDRELGERHPGVVRYLWGDGYLEILPQEADKGSALALLARELGIPRSEVVAFGDGLNDVTMLAWAGRGVAVGPEAHPAAVEAADEHIPSPEEGGVTAWLEANLL